MESTEKIKNFDDLINLGNVSKTIKLAGHDIKLTSLGFDKQSEMLNNIPDNIKETAKFDLLQKEILSAVIESIDGVVLSREQKLELLGKVQTSVVNLLFTQYELLIGDQNQILEDVKKNILIVKSIP